MSFAARVLTHRALRRRHTVGLAVLILLALWIGAWLLSAYQLGRTMDKIVKAAHENGTEITYTHRSRDGTPLAVHMHLDDFAIATKNGNDIKAGEAVFYLNLWDWSDLSAKLRKGIEGHLAGSAFKAGGFKFGFSKPERPPVNHRETGLSLWLQPFALTFQTDKPLPLGNRLDEGFFALRLMGLVPDFTNAASIKQWNEDGGVIEFDDLYLHWGDLTATGSGTLALDPALQPEGAFSARIEGLDTLIANLVEDGVLDKRQEALLESSLHVLARPSGLTGGSSAPIVPISLQDGGLYLGPVKLLTVPKIKWE